ncbi:MAG: SurA N-terminal domain-containing protein [Desulfobacter sp.]|nr:MAG: SurA N-terminal domain-containing protein [Desulfobacter sp.]
MLRYLRENTGNWIIKIFLGIIVIVFVFLGVGSMNANKRNEVALVNDEVITFNEFQDAYRNMIEQMRQQFGNALNEDLIKALNVKEQAVNSLIDQKILDMEADKLKIMVTDGELKDTLVGIKAFQKNGDFDMELYKGVLARNRMTPESFEALQRRAIKNRKLREMVLSGVTVSDEEALAWYRFNNTKTAIEYIKVDPGTFTDITPTPEAVKKEYQDHLDAYKSQPELKVNYLVFSPEDHRDSFEVPGEQARDYYEQNKSRFTTPEQVEASHILIRVAEDADEAAVTKARKEADDIYEKATKGGDFAELAKTYSQGPTGPKGGYLGKFDRRSMVKPFGDAAFAMTAGEISKPVRTQFGFHVIKVISRTAETVESFENAKPAIVKELASQELQNLAYYKAGEAFDAVVDGDDFQQVAMIVKKKVMETPAFSSDGNGLSFDNAGEFAREAFALSGDDISEVKQIGDKYYLIQVKERIAPRQLPLEEVEAGITVTLKEKMQKQAAQESADKLLKAVAEKTTLAEAAKAAGFTPAESKLFTRNQSIPGIPGSTAIASAAFTLDDAKKVYDKVMEAGGSFYVIGFKAQQTPDAATAENELDNVKKEMGYRKQQQYYTAWVKSLKDKADIKINREVIN